MSALITAQIAYSGQPLYAIIRNTQTGLVANGATLVSYNVSNYSSYINNMTEQVPTGFYTVAFPSYLPAGLYSFSVHQGTGIAGDLAVDNGIMDWSGSVENYVGLVPVQVKAQVDASLGTDSIAQLSSVPSSTPSLKTAVMFLFMALRNKRTTTSTTVAIYDASGAVITTAPRSDNGIVGTKDVFS